LAQDLLFVYQMCAMYLWLALLAASPRLLEAKEYTIPNQDDWEASAKLIRDHGGEVHPALRLIEIYGGKGIAIMEPVAKDTRLFAIPNSLIISRKHLNGSFEAVAANHLTRPAVVDAVEGLKLFEPWETEPQVWATAPDATVVVWLATQIWDDSSVLAPYLKYFRDSLATHPCEHSPAEVDSMSEDEFMEQMREELPHMPPFNTANLIDIYEKIAANVDQKLLNGMTFKRYMIAFYFLITRTFNIHGIRGLVPVFDFVNHDHNMTATYTQDEAGEFEAWSHRDLEAGEEITIEYSPLSNNQLYSSYGFTLPMDKTHHHEWNWGEQIAAVYGQKHRHIQALETGADAFVPLVHAGLSVLDVLETVVRPRLQQAAGEDITAVEKEGDLCMLNKKRIAASEWLAVRDLKPVLEASRALSKQFGKEFAESVLASGGEVTQAFVAAARKRERDMANVNVNLQRQSEGEL